MAYSTRRWRSWAIGVLCLLPLGLSQPQHSSAPKNIYSPSTITFARPLPLRHTPGTIVAGFHISFDDSDSGSDPSAVRPPGIACPSNVFLDIETDRGFNYLTRQQYERRGKNLRDFCSHLSCFCDVADGYTVNCPDPDNPDEIRYPMLDYCEERCHCLSSMCCSDSD